MMSPTRKVEEFQELGTDSQLLLEYLSLVGRPLPKPQIAEQFKAYLKSLNRAGDSSTALVSELCSRGFLERHGSTFRVVPEIIEEIATHAAEQGRAISQCELAWKYQSSQTRESRFVKARRALYGGDNDYFRMLFERDFTNSPYDEKPELSLAKLLLQGICTPKPLQYFPMDLSLEVAREGLVASVEEARPAEHLFLWLMAQPKGEPESLYRKVWLFQLLCRDMPHPDAEKSDQYVAFRKVLEGRSQGPEDFSEEYRTGPLAFDFALYEFLYVVACYAVRDFEAIENRLRFGDRKIHALLLWFWEVRTGRRTDFCPSLKRLLKSREYPALNAFIQCLFLYWAGFEKELEAGQVFSLASRFEEAGYPALAGEMEALYKHLVGESEDMTPLLNLLRPVKLWEATLTQLENWQSYAESAKEEATEERIVWVLDPLSNYNSVSAKVQRMGKSGRWTKGRVVKIHELTAQYNHALADDDRRVLNAWALREQQGFNRHRDTDLFRALLGHPRIVDFEGQDIELVEGKPRFVVTDVGESLKVEIVPRPSSHSNYGFLKPSGNRYQIVFFDQNADGLANILPKEGLEIPKTARERIQAILTAVSREGMPVESFFQVDENSRKLDWKTHLVVRLYPEGQGLRVEIGVEPLGPAGPFFPPGEGQRFLTSARRGQNVELSRSLAGERELFQAIKQAVPGLNSHEVYLDNIRHCLEMLEALREFPSEQVSVQWPRGKKLTLSRVIRWGDVRVSVARDNDWFSVNAELNLEDDDSLSLSQLLEKNRLENSRFVILEDGSYVALTKELERKLNALEQAAAKVSDTTFRLHPLTGSVLLDGVEIESIDDAWEETQERIRRARAFEPRLPEAFEGELRPYQLEGYKWLSRCAEWGVGACLADDMGLGKTVQILVALLDRKESGPALVVAPTSVCDNWRSEAQRFTPDLRVFVLGEADRDTTITECGPGDVLICSYGLMCREIEKLKETNWGTVVLDESQAIKNTQTQRFKAAISLSADFRVAATGTPVENHLGELWALFRFLNPGLLGGQKTFFARFGQDEESLETLKAIVSPFILRRLKKDVLKDLPPKTEITVSVELSREERLYYESLRMSAVERLEEEKAGVIHVLAELMKLRRACCHPRLTGGDAESSKLARFMELVENLREGGHRALVFSQFVDHLKLVGEELESQGIPYLYLDGSTPGRKRGELVEAFQQGEGDLFLISLKAGGTGLNLTAANYVVHLDPWWNPATEDQASDRAHRIGQEQAVTVYRLIGKGTIEEKILALHNEKRELVDNLLAGSDRSGKLSPDELLALLRESV